jgi:MoaA/NifB/PqqE/SkfB family radical SAM enzyme
LTSGDLLDDRHIAALSNAGTYVRISVDAGTNSTRRKVHNPMSRLYTLDRVLRNTEKLACAVKGQASTTTGHRRRLVGSTFLMDSVNYTEIYEAARLLKGVGVDHVSFRKVHRRGHSFPLTDRQQIEIQTQLQRVQEDLADDTFQVFVPRSTLTGTMMGPVTEFRECLASSHRTVIEVGTHPTEAHIVPCGRYRGCGVGTEDRTRGWFVLGKYGPNSAFHEVWMNRHMQHVIRAVPQVCTDCIDRGANTLLTRIHGVLTASTNPRFLRMRVPSNGNTGAE